MFLKDISIIIVNYNVKDYLSKCLESIRNASSNLKIETIVVDNNSSDGSVKYLEKHFPEVTFVQLEDNYGFSKANNIGFSYATGKYFLILNPDTIIEEKNLDEMFKFMESHPNTGLAGCKILNPDGSFQLPCRRGFPTPWVSFCKLFGLQSLFPKSKLFAQYNQTFRPIDQTYNIDAVMGAYMFARAELIRKIGGFDEDFFMYGEDLDLCHRIKQENYEVTYVHETSIIHYKGESTKRSSINEIKHFYSAMSIFAKKHFSRYKLFLLLLKFAIFLRSNIAYLNKYKEDVFYIISDSIFINFALIIASKIRFGTYLPFPEYAYPTVFFALTITLIFSMIFSGEYFEDKHTISKASFGILINFFLVSSLTYFFKEYAFSRGIILIVTGLLLFKLNILRIITLLFKKSIGIEKDKRLLIIGLTQNTENILNAVNYTKNPNLNIIGLVSLNETYPKELFNYQILGNINNLKDIIIQYKINEIVIADRELSQNKWFKIINETSNTKAKYHIASEFDELIASEIIEEISEIKSVSKKFEILSFRNMFFKRFTDILFSSVIIVGLIPFSFLKQIRTSIRNIFKVLLGHRSFIGLYDISSDDKPLIGKIGLTGLAHISSKNSISIETIKTLNEYYLKNYSISLDLEILIKTLIRRRNK